MQVFTLTNSQPFPASYKWIMAEGADPSVWSVTPASGQLGGPGTEEVTVRWTPKPKAPPGEDEVSTAFPQAALVFCCCCVSSASWYCNDLTGKDRTTDLDCEKQAYFSSLPQ